ncbi:RNA 3'-terminal phosphate cyclase [Candidatus Woesearchaeota archaeon]|nr:RNA 3'-terminal phosphate cyclase [Candidatus Woesearchaeota archaeon]
MLNIDGSHNEGGGQILRTALALSALTGKSFDIHSIRKGRKIPGLKAQHKHGVLALKQLCSAKFADVQVGSENISFYPGVIKHGNYEIDIGTAGSITLLMQSILLPSIFADGKVSWHITGGTDVIWSPQFDYFANVLIPYTRKFAEIEARLEKRGYYPKGGGRVLVKINPKYHLKDFESFSELRKYLSEQTKPHNLEKQMELVKINGIAHSSKRLQERNVAERLMETAKGNLLHYKVPVDIRVEYTDTYSDGCGITLWALFSDGEDTTVLGADGLGERKVTSEEVATKAAESLRKEINSGAVVDKRLADQLVPFIALVKGSVIKTSEITKHCETNIWAVEQFLGKCFEVDEENKKVKVIK